MSKTLVITVEFSEDSDFDFFRARFVGVVEDAVAEAIEPEEGGPAADGTIETGWDVEEES